MPLAGGLVYHCHRWCCCSVTVPRLPPSRKPVLLLLVHSIASFSPLLLSSSSSCRALCSAASSASSPSSSSLFLNLGGGSSRRCGLHPFLIMECFTCEDSGREKRMEGTYCSVASAAAAVATLLLPLCGHHSHCVAAVMSVLPLCFYPCYPASASSAVMPLLNTDNQFWTRGSIDKNKELVEHLQQYGVIKSKKVAEVMKTIDRGLFVPNGTAAYVDSPVPIGYNATISAPHMHATCLELLKEHLQPGMRALDVGSGTGYLTACFSLMVGPQGRAVGLEHIPELVTASIENIKRSAAADLLEGGSLSVHLADGRLGWPELAPYDAIHVGAASPDLPQPLIQQLKPGGRMVIPVGKIFQELKVVDKGLDGSVSVYSETAVRYVPLTSRTAQLQGE